MTVFVDTSALLALLDADEARHGEAVETWRRLLHDDHRLITSNYVLVETYALVQRRLGSDAVDELASLVLPLIEVDWIDQPLHDAAVSALITARQRDLSLVDCASFEVARRARARKAFAFDRHFTARGLVPPPEVASPSGSEIGLIAFGSSHWALLEARAELAATGVKTDYLRVRGLPLHALVAEFVKQHDRVYVIEQNRDGQLAERIRLESPERAARVRSVLHYDGLPIDARSVTDGVLAHEGVPLGATR